MALGGGRWLVQNKKLPGTYANFVSVRRAANVFGDRGVVAMPIAWDWANNEIIVLDSEDFMKKARAIFMTSYMDDRLFMVREVLKHAKTLILFPYTKDTAYAQSTSFKAVKRGEFGKKLKVTVENYIDSEDVQLVKTYCVEAGREILLVEDLVKKAEMNKYRNEFIMASKAVNSESKVTETFTHSKSDGEDPIPQFLEELQTYRFNILVEAGGKNKDVLSKFTIDMREDKGIKFQYVDDAEETQKTKFNHEGLVAVYHNGERSLKYWFAGALAGIDVNKSLDNSIYDGELEVKAPKGARAIEDTIDNGVITLIKNKDEYRVLEDINSFRDYEPDKNEDFSSNQIIRVNDQIAMDWADIFNKRYYGKVQNNDDGRISLWNEFVHHCNKLQLLGAIQNFDGADIKVLPGEDKDSVLVEATIYPVMAMRKLYMTIFIG